jgi:hypothetical protein
MLIDPTHSSSYGRREGGSPHDSEDLNLRLSVSSHNKQPPVCGFWRWLECIQILSKTSPPCYWDLAVLALGPADIRQALEAKYYNSHILSSVFTP